MNSIKSVLTGPYFVFTVQPSTMGRISRCTPSLETSGPFARSPPAILSISSINTIPSCSALSIASRITSSISISLSDSSWVSILLASVTFTRRFFLFFGSMPPIISLRLRSMPIASMVSLPVDCCSTSTSTSSFSSSPLLSCSASCCRLVSLADFSSSVSSFSSGSDVAEPKSICMGFIGFCCFFASSGISRSISLCSAAAFATVSTAS